jgi:uncharacterized DUF497 family protein
VARLDICALTFVCTNGICEKCRKHGVSTAEIETMLSKPFAIFPDPAHSGSEERFKAIGTNDAAP